MLEDRVAQLEQDLAYYAETISKLCVYINVDNGNITTHGNIYQIGERADNDPIKFFMGESLDRGLYLSFDKRDPAEGTEYMAKIETFERPPADVPVAAGYGAIPLRISGMLGIDELNGVSARRYIVANEIWQGELVHRHPHTGDYVRAHHYDTKSVPWGDEEETVMLGGAYWERDAEGNIIARRVI
jgi:hypothetical protein